MTSRLDSLREALAVSPHNIPLLLLFGYACSDELSFAEARAAFDRILQADSAHAEAKLGIARVLYLSGNTSEAVVRAEALTEADPGFAEAWVLLSRLAVAEGDCLLATQYYQKAIKLNPALSPDWMKFSWQALRDGRFVAGDDPSGAQLGRMDSERWATMYQQLLELKVIEKPFDPATAYTLQFVQ